MPSWRNDLFGLYSEKGFTELVMLLMLVSAESLHDGVAGNKTNSSPDGSPDGSA